MSTTTAPAEIPVPRDLLPAFRENVKNSIEMLADSLKSAITDDEPELEDICDEIHLALMAHRAFARDADAYPADLVRLAAGYVIADAASRITDDGLTVDEAEFYVRRVRACEALREPTV